MNGVTRAVLCAGILAVAACSSGARTDAGNTADVAADTAVTPFRVLLFSRTTEFRHADATRGGGQRSRRGFDRGSSDVSRPPISPVTASSSS
jgi:hypothetical protein